MEALDEAGYYLYANINHVQDLGARAHPGRGKVGVAVRRGSFA